MMIELNKKNAKPLVFIWTRPQNLSEKKARFAGFGKAN